MKEYRSGWPTDFVKSAPTVSAVRWIGRSRWALAVKHSSRRVYTDLHHVFVLEDIGEDQNGDKIKERRNGSGAKVYGVNLDAKVAHGREAQLQLGFTVQRSRYNRAEVWTSEGEEEQTTKRNCPVRRTTTVISLLRSAPLKNFDFSLSVLIPVR